MSYQKDVSTGNCRLNPVISLPGNAKMFPTFNFNFKFTSNYEHLLVSPVSLQSGKLKKPVNFDKKSDTFETTRPWQFVSETRVKLTAGRRRMSFYRARYVRSNQLGDQTTVKRKYNKTIELTNFSFDVVSPGSMCRKLQTDYQTFHNFRATWSYDSRE